MKLEDQVLSIEQSKHLQEFGLKMDDAAFWWVQYTSGEWKLQERPVDLGMYKSYTPTYTLQEVLSKLPKRIIKNNKRYHVCVDYEIGEDYEVSYLNGRYAVTAFFGRTLFDPAYNMLCWLANNDCLGGDK